MGSVEGNDIVLPVRGISRQHALVSLEESGVFVEDLDSKNGVLVNGSRIRRKRIGPGDEIHFGPVLLRLEEVEADDAELAIAIPSPSRATPKARQGEPVTTTEELSVSSPHWLSLVEAFLQALSSPGELSEGIRFLVRELGATGACVLQWTGPGDCVVLAAAAQVGSLSEHGPFTELLNAVRGRKDAKVQTELFSDPHLACSLLGSNESGIGFLIWGDFSGRAQSVPFLRSFVRLLDRLRPAISSPRPEQRRLKGLAFPPGYVAGASAPMSALFEQMLPLVQGDLPVLILGETGTGKEHLAEILHKSSARHGPLIAINCAAIPSDLLEAEMFGIGKGVATGVTERRGKFELAGGGTLFLDEIGDMPPDLQAKLLRALEEKKIHPVGGGSVAIDIRIVAATNTDLQSRIDAGRFRRDLFYRVAGAVVKLPALRERAEDIPPLVEAFLRTFAGEARKSIRGLTVKALRTLMDYPWPGNVRELEHEVRRLVYLCPDDRAIDYHMLSQQIRTPTGKSQAATDLAGSLELGLHVRNLEAQLIREALSRAGGNRTQAAKYLGVSRNGLAIKMQRLNLTE